MILSSALAAALSSLSGAIKDPNAGLEARLQLLADDLKVAVSSYLGLTVTIAMDGHEISFSLTERGGPAATSLCLPLPEVAGSEPGSSLVLYGATPGAFVDLAADLTWALALDPAAIVLDAHLDVPRPSDVVTGLHEQGIVNQALGVLIERGHAFESARAELRRQAKADNVGVPVSAQRILDDLEKQTVRRPD
jgi:hypothetical protein